MGWNIKKVVKTVAFVTIFSCIERFVGFIYRIFLSRTLGAEMLGIYQITLSVVGVLVTLTASGIPITVSRLMVKERTLNSKNGEIDIVWAGIITSLILSLPITAALYFGRNVFSFIFADQRCYSLLLIILPSVVITAVYAVIRGFFWGKKYFFTYSLIELIEEVVMCVAGVILVSRAVKTSLFDGGKMAAKSVMISYVVSFILSSTVFALKGAKFSNPVSKMKQLVKSAAPITAMRTLTSSLSSIIAVILPARLIALGQSNEQVLGAFGQLTGMAIPLLYIPSTLIGSIALVIVPRLSETFYKKRTDKLNELIGLAFDYSLVIASLIVPVFICAGKQIGTVVYSSPSAGSYLSVSAFMMLPMSLTMMSNSVLNSVNRENATLINFFVGAIVMILCITLLPRFCGIYSLVIGCFLNYVINAVLNIVVLNKITGKAKKYLAQALGYAIACTVTVAFGSVLVKTLSAKLSAFWFTAVLGVVLVAFQALLLWVLGIFTPKKILLK